MAKSMTIFHNSKYSTMKQIVYRSAKTGRFVSQKVAKRRPATTVKEIIHRKKRK